MCGIVGIYAYGPDAAQVDRDELDTMRDYMSSRGPDDHGTWLHDSHRLAFGHRRLSIIDLSERGRQPMHAPDGTAVITYNGEIYNYRALRRELEDEGVQFSSDSDTEVLLQLYAARGESMFDALRGMYAFAIWDQSRESLIVARDPHGIKPLYIADDGGCVRFGSQVKALLAGNRVSRTSNQAGIAGFYLFGSVPEPHTVFEAIEALPAGTFCTWTSKGRGATRRHASIAEVWRKAVVDPEVCSSAERRRRVAEAVRDSVRHHMVADVPVGAFLSAGIDSTTLLAVMSELSERPVQTVTMAFDEFRGGSRDEAPLAAEIAERYRARHQEAVVTKDDFLASVPAILEAMDQPSVDGINTWLVSRATRALGLKVAVSGLGGDELFGGYPNTFGVIPKMVRALALPSRSRALGKAWRHLVTKSPIGRRINPKVASLLELGGTYAGAYMLRRGAFMPWELPAVMTPDEAEAGLVRLRPLGAIERALDPDPQQPFARIATLEAALYMRNQLLRDSDWASMAHSLELRVPLVDIALLRRLAPLLADPKTARTKEWLAAAARPTLPAAILDKPKTGFGIPISEWIVGARDGTLDDWRRVPALMAPNCPWARRLAYVLLQRATAA